MFKYLLANIHHQVVITTPKLLAIPSTFIPFFVIKKLLSELLSKLFAEAISEGELHFLQEKWLKVEVTDLKLTWFLSFSEDKLIIAEQCDHQDVTFSGAVNELILIAGRKEDPDTLFFQRRLSIEGDTELGLEIKNLLENIDFDNLSPFVTKAIDRFSGFVQQGLTEPEQKTVSA